ncbi:prokineticin receptor 1-like isoform X2 [Schistocerca piceifrons]|uniref:prokineticin receptor 1-like isoform X2 n=1 Tax=Schistocerca piceifrons TaxID=274613 RepID=UPI001F5FC362|nr:prokineticin receptor 1-like isoform X2 [Schistocerca piceifrons]
MAPTKASTTFRRLWWRCCPCATAPSRCWPWWATRSSCGSWPRRAACRTSPTASSPTWRSPTSSSASSPSPSSSRRRCCSAGTCRTSCAPSAPSCRSSASTSASSRSLPSPWIVTGLSSTHSGEICGGAGDARSVVEWQSRQCWCFRCWCCSARPTKLRARLSIAAIWCLSAALAAPMAAALRVTIVTEKIGEQWVSKPFCVNVHLSNKAMMSYRMVLFLVQYLIPLCVITYVYARMALRLWGSKAPGNAQDLRDATLMKNKKRVIKMLVIVVALFALCWLPLQTYNVLQDVFPYINEYHYINIIFFCCDWLAMSNSCYNPFIYGIYNEKFKREFRQRFPWKKSACSASPVTETEDLDGCGGGSGGGGGGGGGALCSTRSSLRVPNCTPGGYDWRRAYSAAPVRQQPSASQHDAVSGLLRGSASRRVACPVGVGGGGGGGGGCCEQAGQPQNGHLAGRDTELFVFGGARSRHHHRHQLFGSREELCSL